MKTFQIKKIAYYLFLGVLTVLITKCSKDDPKDSETQQITGCKDPEATNYNADADVADNSLCSYVLGCTDPNADNYNENAVKEDNSCTYFGCTDALADNFNASAQNENGSCSYTGDLTIQFTENPGDHTRKVLLETFVGTWNGWSVDVPIVIAGLKEEYGDNIITSRIHQGSLIANQSFYTYMDEVFDVVGFPSGMVNRRASIVSQNYVMSRSEWEDNIDEQADEVVNVGLAISALINDNDELEVFVETGFSSDEEDVSLHVHLLEDGIVAAQYNYYSSEYSGNEEYEDHPYYDEVSLIEDHQHDNVFRESLTPHEGLSIPNTVIASDRKFQRMFKVVDLSNYDMSNLKIIGFVAKNGETIDKKYVLNVQQLVVNGDGTLSVQDYD